MEDKKPIQSTIERIQEQADLQIGVAERLKTMAPEAKTENDRERLYNEVYECLNSAAKLRDHVINLIHIQHVEEDEERNRRNLWR
jgi:hypothetical protein